MAYAFFFSDTISWEGSDQKTVQIGKDETMCASTSAASSPDEEKPQGCGDTNGQVLTFDCAVLYPQLWISDSKRPYPWGLMCSARLQARTESRRSEKCDNDSIESYNDWFSQCWDKNDRCIPSGPNRTLRNLPALYPIKMRVYIKGTKIERPIFCMWSYCIRMLSSL